MDDLDMLARDFGFGARGKSNPMRSDSGDRSRPATGSVDDPLFNDVFGGAPKYTSSSNSYSNDNNNKHSPMSDFDYDSIFKSSELKNNYNSSSSTKTSSVPVYDKPVYDEDIFDGLPGLKSKPAASTVRFDDDMFASISSPPTSKSRNRDSDFDDLLGNFGRNEKVGENNNSSSAKSSSSSRGFDDLLPGFGSGSSAANSRPVPESSQGSLPKYKPHVMDDPFVVLKSTSATGSSSSKTFADPLDEISKIGKSKSARTEASPGSGQAFDDLDPLNTFAKSVRSFSPGRDNERMNKSPSRSATPQSGDPQKKVPTEKFQEPPLFDVPFGQNPSSPLYNETGPVDTSPVSAQMQQQYDDIWLTVSEIPLFTQPTNAPPPSRTPPPIPRQTYYTKDSQSPKKAKGPPPVSQFDELDDFAKGFSRNEEVNASSSAAVESAAAMKDAMDKAEAKFRHAKELRERESARNKKDEQDEQERLKQHERKQKDQEEEEIEQRMRLERDREREREKAARQAVERATREARERAATEAHERAANEARLKTERAAVVKANAEARGRAERVAVQRVQAEARVRAAAEAKERAEKAAAEARERAAASAAESTREKETAARAEAEARRRAERAAVERAAAEARERAAAEARERAAANKVNQQQNNENDLDSFFGMGRASTAPRARANATDPMFDPQFPNKGGSEAAKRTSSSSSMKKASSTSNIVDDLSSIFGAPPSSGDFHDVEGETDERRRARLDRHQRTQERAAKALAEKNQRDIQSQRDQEERHRISETLDIEIKRWAAGKEGNLRALLSTLQYVLWPECGWQPVSLTDLIVGASVKKVYRKATLCIHPDKVQQKGATLQQKYIAEKVFDLLKEAWNKFNSEELF